MDNGTEPLSNGDAFTDVNALPLVSADVAANIKAAAIAEGNLPDQEGVLFAPELVTKPGEERWPVKTGTDTNVAQVGLNIIDGDDLGAGIVEATVEELIAIPRPPGMRPVTGNFDKTLHASRLGIVEFTVWTVDVSITVLKQEADGDYHLVLQGATGSTMIGEVPTPKPPFVVASSPWLPNIATARQAVDDKLVSHLSPRDFVQVNGTFVPKASLPTGLQAHAVPAPESILSFVTPPPENMDALVTFQTAIEPTKARVTGIGFFDADHNQTGVSRLNGIELHPILKIEWL